MNTKKNILLRIENLREEMATVALDKGFTNTESIHISQELDRLLNLYEKIRDDQKDSN